MNTHSDFNTYKWLLNSNCVLNRDSCFYMPYKGDYMIIAS